jgi:hypothetical protein
MEEEEKENRQIRKDVETRAYQLEDRFPGSSSSNRAFASLGICGECSNLLGFVTKYGNRLAKCQEFNMRLTETNCIESCTGFWKKGHQDIKSLVGMATLIDVRRKVGFGNNDDY